MIQTLKTHINLKKTHINLKKNVENINDIINKEDNNSVENYNIKYGKGYKDKEGIKKFLETYTFIEENINYTLILMTDTEENKENVIFKVFQMDDDNLNRKIKIINDFILNKLKNKYSKEIEDIITNYKNTDIKIKVYIQNNNYLKIFIIIEK